ncbi:MAG: DnaJ domain-containing protein, partial [Armatimonadota bacterium]|nr:DnaJ domain-containing protein [Armatimonadota bacterium]
MLKKNERATAIQQARRLLKIQSSATLQQIKDTYRERARDLHPDVHPNEERNHWEEQMRETNAAYG